MIKQYILIRTDEKFMVGKIMAHVGHNVLEAYLKIDMKKHYDGTWWIFNTWHDKYDHIKIVLDGGSKENIEDLIKRAKRLRMPTSFIIDIHLEKKIVGVIGPVTNLTSKHLGLDKLKLYRL